MLPALAGKTHRDHYIGITLSTVVVVVVVVVCCEIGLTFACNFGILSWVSTKLESLV